MNCGLSFTNGDVFIKEAELPKIKFLSALLFVPAATIDQYVCMNKYSFLNIVEGNVKEDVYFCIVGTLPGPFSGGFVDDE
jgi:hypothetical protein